jgi:hypothetical protein
MKTEMSIQSTDEGNAMKTDVAAALQTEVGSSAK